MKFYSDKRGVMLIMVLVFASISAVLLAGLIGWSGINITASRQAAQREQAFQIAEAGIEYYRWHLAHDPDDFQDGTGTAGPYIHDFFDKAGNKIGEYSLEIIPPGVGSTVVTVRSTGTILSNPQISRTIEAQYAKPSFARYAWLLNSSVTFGTGAVVFGPIHSNYGIRFDGTSYNTIYSAVSSYDDETHNDNDLEFGVHTHRSPPPPIPFNFSLVTSFRPLEAPPNPIESRTDVFLAGREFPVPAIDFSSITQNLSIMRQAAIDFGFYRAQSGASGYKVVLKTDDTFDLYTVNTLVNPGNGCRASAGNPPGWGSWSISTANNSTNLIGNYAIPANGLIFLEDHVFVSGQINTARLTIAAGTFPVQASTYKNIIINEDLRYTNYDGRDVIGLIAQGNLLIGLRSEDDLRIDGALIAQNGWVGRFNYPSNNCGVERHRALLTTYSSMATNLPSAFCYGIDCNASGYLSRVYNYDPHLLYSPPPSFPLTSDEYIRISWKEI